MVTRPEEEEVDLHSLDRDVYPETGDSSDSPISQEIAWRPQCVSIWGSRCQETKVMMW